MPDHLRSFIDAEQWTYARTMPQWPHECIVRGRVDELAFAELVRHIRAHGYEGRFYNEHFTFYDDRGWTYWTIGESLEDTTIINRCLEENTYEHRLRAGTLPQESASRSASTGVPVK